MAVIDARVPQIARVYDYWLGGRDNFAADRELGDRAVRLYPDLVHTVRANRAFLARSVYFLAREAGIRQFLDVGTGLPTANNTHEVAQRAASDCRVVYVDRDPMVLSHARALLKSTPGGACAYLDADLHNTAGIVAGAAETLDFSRPVAVLLIAILHFVGDDTEARGVVRRLLAACAPGSYVAISHAASDIEPDRVAAMARTVSESLAEDLTPRDEAGVTSLFGSFGLIEPGVVPAPRWRPDYRTEAEIPAAIWAAVARKS